MRFPEYNIFQSLYPNITKPEFEEVYGRVLTLDDFCSKVGAYMVARSMFPNDPDPMGALLSAKQQERQVAQRTAPTPEQTKQGCCGGGQVK